MGNSEAEAERLACSDLASSVTEEKERLETLCCITEKNCLAEALVAEVTRSTCGLLLGSFAPRLLADNATLISR